MAQTKFRQVLECASPLALSKRQKAAAVQNTIAPFKTFDFIR
jgi:hypothetical protein